MPIIKTAILITHTHWPPIRKTVAMNIELYRMRLCKQQNVITTKHKFEFWWFNFCQTIVIPLYKWQMEKLTIPELCPLPRYMQEGASSLLSLEHIVHLFYKALKPQRICFWRCTFTD